MHSYIRKVLVIIAAAGMFGCNESGEFARKLDDSIAREVPIGSERTTVVEFLRRHGLQDAASSVPSSRASFVEDRSRNYIVAVVRNIERTPFTRTDLRIGFYFDDHNRFTGYKAEKMLTGP
jgi:hypothetical protein